MECVFSWRGGEKRKTDRDKQGGKWEREREKDRRQEKDKCIDRKRYKGGQDGKKNDGRQTKKERKRDRQTDRNERKRDRHLNR